MAAKNMSNCFLCGTEYEVCKMCQNVAQYTPWRKECDTPRHWQIYMIVKELRKGILRSDEAKKQLDHLKVNMAEVKTFVSSVQDTLLPLYNKAEATKEATSVATENNKSRKAAKKTVAVEKVVEEAIVEDEQTEEE